MDDTGNVLDLEMITVRDYQDSLAEIVSRLWVSFYHSPEQQEHRREVSEVKRFLYATDTQSTSNSANPHSHTTHRGKLAQIADTLEAHYLDAWFPHADWGQFKPGSVEDNNINTKRLVESYMKDRHELSNFIGTAGRIGRDWIEDGNAFGEAVWTSDTAGEVDNILRKAYIGPKIRRIDPRRIAYNNDATSFHDSWKVIQAIKTKGDIVKEINDETLPESYREILSKSMQFRNYMATYSANLGEEFLDGDFAACIGVNQGEVLFGQVGIDHQHLFHGVGAVFVAIQQGGLGKCRSREEGQSAEGQSNRFHIVCPFMCVACEGRIETAMNRCPERYSPRSRSQEAENIRKILRICSP